MISAKFDLAIYLFIFLTSSIVIMVHNENNDTPTIAYCLYWYPSSLCCIHILYVNGVSRVHTPIKSCQVTPDGKNQHF